MRRLATAVAVLTLLLLARAAPGRALTYTVPPTGTDWDYQLGGWC